MMKRTINKLMALLCCLAITMSWLPAIPAMAAETELGSDTTTLSGIVDPSTLADDGEYVLVGDVTLDGKVTLTGDLTIDLAGYTITGSTAPYFQVVSGTKLTLTDSSTEKTGKLDGSGLTGSTGYGLVWVSGSDAAFTLAGGAITGHTTSVNGGGVYNNGTFTMSGGVIENNTISNSATAIMYGAGVYNNGTFTMSGGEIRNNTALGKTYEYGVAVYVGAGKTFTMSGGTISGNKATNDGRGAVYLAGTDSVFTMTGGTISGHSEKFTHGGAVMARAGSTFKMQGGTIKDNSVSNNGGAVYGYGTTTINMTGGSISGNTAANAGQNILAYGPTAISGGALGSGTDKDAIYRINSAATLVITGNPVIGGGGIATLPAMVTVKELTKGARIHSKVELSDVDDTVKETEQEDGTFLYTCTADSQLSGNVDPADIANGGEYVLTGDVTLDGKVTLTGDLTLDLNGCTLSGPAVPYFTVPDGTALTVKDSSDGKTGALVGIGGETGANLGASNYQGVVLITSGGVYNMYDITMRDHHSGIVYNADGSVKNNYNAGAVRVNSGGTFNMYSGTISGNIAPGSAGAVLLNSGGTFNMSGGTITDNSSGSTGGGVWVQGTMNMTGGTITGNSSDSTGDDIYVRNGGVLNISGVSVIADVYLQSTAALVAISQLEEGASISANKELTDLDTSVTYSVTDSVYTYTWLDLSTVSTNLTGKLDRTAFAVPSEEYKLVGNVTLTESIPLSVGEYVLDLAGYTISGTATPFFTVPAGGRLTIIDSSTDKTGKLDASGVENSQAATLVANGTLDLDGGTITGNLLKKDYLRGLAVRVNATGVFNMTGGEISGNSTYDTEAGKCYSSRGAVGLYQSGTFNMSGGTITGNTAPYGPAIANSGAADAWSTINISGGTITGNTATSTDPAACGGSAMFIGNSRLTMTGGEISGNTTTTTNAGYKTSIFFDGGVCTLAGGTLGNDAQGSTAVYALRAQTSSAANGSTPAQVYLRGSVRMGTAGFHLVSGTARVGALEGEAEIYSAVKLDHSGDPTVKDAASTVSGRYKYVAGEALPAPEGAIKLTADSVFYPGAVYYLADDVELPASVTLNGGGVYTIYLDGHILTGKTAPFFTVAAGNTLIIKDQTGDLGWIKGLASSTEEMIVVSGTLQLDAGTLCQNTNTKTTSVDGGAVKVNNGGEFIMNGGAITDNTTAGRGGAVCLAAGGTFTMNGGTIQGNTAQYGGAINAQGKTTDGAVTNPVTIRIDGGTITGNKATTGGSAVLANAARITMTGGNIMGNTTTATNDRFKSAICIGGSTFHMSGGAVTDDAQGSTALYSVNIGANEKVNSSAVLSGNAKVNSLNLTEPEADTVTVQDLGPLAAVYTTTQATVAEEDQSVKEKKLSDTCWHYYNMEPLRVLSIGNSYSRDSFYYLPRLSQAVGQPIEAAYLYVGSCTLRQHATYMAMNTKPSVDDSKTDGVANDPSVVYSYYKTNMDPTSDKYGALYYVDKVNSAYALADEEWDVIMLHQGTTIAGLLGTYNSDIDYLVDAVKAVRPDAKLYWNMTWAYDENDTGRLAKSSSTRVTDFATYYNSDQVTMYNANVDCTAVNFVGEDAIYADVFDGWFPVGAAIQTLRAEDQLGDNLTRDGYHLSYGGGRLTAAMTILKTLRPTADLDLITAEEIAPYLDTTDDSGTADVETFTDVFTGSEEQLALVRAAVEQVTADLSVPSFKLTPGVKEPTVEAATGGAHRTVAQVDAPMMLHFPDVAKLDDGSLVVGAYENVAHTPVIDNSSSSFGRVGAGRLIIWKGEADGSSFNTAEPLLIIDQQQLDEWGVVSLSDRYAQLADGTLTTDTYVIFSDPRDPNLTVTHVDTDGDGVNDDEMLLLTFWVRNFRPGGYSSIGTFMTWSTDSGETWAEAEQVTSVNGLKRGDIAVFDDGQILLPSYSGKTPRAHLLSWNSESKSWVEERYTTITDPASEETGDNEFNETSFVAPDPAGDIVYAYIRANGVVLKSSDRGATWELIANEDGLIHQPGFAVIDTNRVYTTWARASSPRNTYGKVFKVNHADGWGATTGEVVYDMNTNYVPGVSVTGKRDSGDPSAELMDNGKVFVVTYDSAYHAIVGTVVDIAESLTDDTTELTTGTGYRLDGDVTLDNNVTASGSVSIDLAGHTLSGAITVLAGGTLAIRDSSEGQTGVFQGEIPDGAVIYGGRFTQDPSDNLATEDAYRVDRDGELYKVVPGLDSYGQYIDFGSSLDMGLVLQGANGINGDVDKYVVTTSKGDAKLGKTSDGMLLLMANGIPAKELRDEITFAVTKGGTTYYTGTISGYDAARSWRDGSTDEKYRTMLADMLNYSDEAKKELGDDPDYTYTPVEGGTADAPVWEASAEAGVTGNNSDKVQFTLSLENKVELNIYVNNPDAQVTAAKLGETAYSDYTIEKVTSKDGTKTVTRITFGNIDVVDAKTPVSLSVKLPDETTFDITYSIKDYVVNMVGGKQGAVLKALQKYVDSVIDFLS